MSMADEFPTDLRYDETDEWVRQEGDLLVCGITAYASEQLGDIVYVKLPDVGMKLGKGDVFGEVESVKAVSDLNAPVGGEVLEANQELDENPALINEDPYGRGWILKLRPGDVSELDTLMDAVAYQQNTAGRH
jgi:glycine cleavage system H protein